MFGMIHFFSLWNWYGNHYARVSWAGVLSERFSVGQYVMVFDKGEFSPYFYLEFTLMSFLYRHS